MTRISSAYLKATPATRILVLEDSPSVRELLAIHLSNAGYAVLQAEDAIIAGKLVLEAAPDLIVADVKLPYMSGIEFIAALRTEPSFTDIPVVFLSSADLLETVPKELRAAACLMKPVRVDRLLDVIALSVPASRADTPPGLSRSIRQ